jgi:hypothetical protein
VPARRDDGVDRGGGERGAAEVGVQDDAGRVEDRAQAARGVRQGRHGGLDDPVRIERAGAGLLLGGDDRGLDRGPAEAVGGGDQAGIGEDNIGTRHTPARIHGHLVHSYPLL